MGKKSTKVTLTCECCSTEYQVKKSRSAKSRCCSRICMNNILTEERRTPMHTCPTCEIEFKPTKKTQICCSSECDIKRRDCRSRKEQICKYCGDGFTSYKIQKYCSYHCSMKKRMSDPKERKKVSLRTKGKVGPNKGKKMSKEFCDTRKAVMKAFYESPAGDATRAHLSDKLTEFYKSEEGAQTVLDRVAKNGGNGPYKQGIHHSPKANEIRYESSYEERAFKILDWLGKVETYERHKAAIPYELNGASRSYFPDILVTHIDGTQHIIEIKPNNLLKSAEHKAKFLSANKYCKENDMKFTVWTETKLEQAEAI